MPKVRIAKVSELEAGQGKQVEAEGRPVALFNVDGTFYAMDNSCCHRGGPLSEGHLEGKVVTCPWHAWRFDVTSGVSELSPDAKVPTYPVEIRDKEIYIDLGGEA